jgi:hypothetical protein
MSYRYEIQFFGGEYRVYKRGRIVYRTEDQSAASRWVQQALEDERHPNY